MTNKLLIALALTSGLALAQNGNNAGSGDQSQYPPGTQTQPTVPNQQPASPITSTDQNNQNSQSAATNSSGGQDTVVRGCLKQSSGNWIVSQNGQETTLSGDNSMLKPHDGQQVEVHGAQSGGTLQVTSVNTISDACTGGGASTASATLPQESMANPPVSSQTPANTVGSGSQSAAGTATSTGQIGDAAQTAPASSDQSAGSGATQTPSSTPNTPESAGTSTSDQSVGSASARTSSNQDQGASAADREQAAKNIAQLPQTSSPLPLLGLLGFGSLVIGLVTRKR